MCMKKNNKEKACEKGKADKDAGYRKKDSGNLLNPIVDLSLQILVAWPGIVQTNTLV